MKEFVFVGQNDSNDVPQPPCHQQTPQPSIGGSSQESTQYQHVRALEKRATPV